MNKVKILESLVKKMTDDSHVLADEAKNMKDATIEAPGRNQSRYDSSKEEFGVLADSLSLHYTERIKGINLIKKFKFQNNSEMVRIGTLVSLGSPKGTINYFVLPYGGGEKVEVGKQNVVVITPGSPVFKSMSGKKVGEEFFLKNTNYNVLDIF
ncbi:MAG: hypothetical protein KKB62_03480 [Nanoarchaeota archaeon]|nr:hypothetical protein [Nanoarchaeota archaeon]